MPVNVAKPGVLEKLADQHMAKELDVNVVDWRKVKERKSAPSASMIAAMRLKFGMPLEKWTDVFESLEDTNRVSA